MDDAASLNNNTVSKEGAWKKSNSSAKPDIVSYKNSGEYLGLIVRNMGMGLVIV